MSKYGIYGNHVEFFNNIEVSQKIKYIKSETEVVIGTVTSISALGVRAITLIEDDTKKRYLIFPLQSSKCEMAN